MKQEQKQKQGTGTGPGTETETAQAEIQKYIHDLYYCITEGRQADEDKDYYAIDRCTNEREEKKRGEKQSSIL